VLSNESGNHELENTMQQHHVVIGNGPVGSGVTARLVEEGLRVTVVTRRGSGISHPLVTRVAADAADADALTKAADSAATIFNCANPPYAKWETAWPPIHHAIMTAAGRTGAVVTMMDNLYGFGPGSSMPMRERDALRATGTKGATRARMATELLEAHRAGTLRATLARASDFFGPGVRDAALGERAIPKILAGKKVALLGRVDQPHSVSYMPDVTRTLVTIALDSRAWGSPWHVPNAPAVTQAELVGLLGTAAGTSSTASSIPKLALKALGLFNPTIRELQETWYQFAEPFVTDATLTEQTFGLSATSLEEAAHATIEWWRAQGRPS
jgi:nucleoside-diphosphate-sugar epimerase